MKTLSICIPSYNRFEKLCDTVNKILECDSDDYEIVLIDNCSPRDINEYIIKDERVRIVKREKSVYGVKNVGDAITFAESQFALLLLDKDTISGDYLEKFIGVLRSDSDIAGGYCQLNSENDKYTISGRNAVGEFGYLSKHPSGDFFRIDLLRKYIKDKEVELEKDPFPFDIYLAYCASIGKMLLYDSPLVFSELNNPTAKDTGTLTFKKAGGNIYYFPDNRLQEFQTYTKCLFELALEKQVKMDALGRIYRSTVYYVTTGLKKTMLNPQVCQHYGHEPEKITYGKMVANYLKLRSALYGLQDENVTMHDKRRIELETIKKAVKKALAINGNK